MQARKDSLQAFKDIRVRPYTKPDRLVCVVAAVEARASLVRDRRLAEGRSGGLSRDQAGCHVDGYVEGGRSVLSK